MSNVIKLILGMNMCEIGVYITHYLMYISDCKIDNNYLILEINTQICGYILILFGIYKLCLVFACEKK